MAIRISDLVIAGEVFNTGPFSVHGRLLLRGCEQTVLFELTGAPAEDLRGRGLEFRVPKNNRPATADDRKRARAFKSRQIGATGEITAARQVKIFDGPPIEFHERSMAGERPETRTVPCLYLEWFGQNGRIVIEIPEPELSFLEIKKDKPVLTDFLPPEASEFECTDELASPLQDEADLESFAAFAEDAGPEDEPTPGEEGYGLVPDELNRELERSARRIDREMSGLSDEENQTIEELELMDELIEYGKGTPIVEICADLKLPAPEAISTEQAAEEALRSALGGLALHGVAFHICAHCTARQAYRLLIEQVLPECEVYPELRGTDWVQHFCSSDFCPTCQADC